MSPVLTARPVAGLQNIGAAAPPLEAGQTLTGRVVSADAGNALIAVAGRTVRVETTPANRLTPGQTLSLQVLSVGPGSLVLRRLDVAEASGATTALGQASAVRQGLAAALNALGVTPDERNMQAAQALVRFGITLTAENLSDVRRGVASRVVRLPETVALAKSLELAPSPAVLRALDTLLTARTDTSLLTITVPMRPDTAGIATHLQMAAQAATESVEHKLLRGDIDGARTDLRSHMLRRAMGGDADAEAAARHLEGQMLTNAARAGRPGGDGSILVAFVAATGARSQYVEMHLKPRITEDEAKEDNEEENGGSADTSPKAGATLHIPTSRLGMVTARLHLSADGRLSCRLAATDEEGTRRIERSVGNLTEALEQAGFVNPTAKAQAAETLPEPSAPPPPRAAATRPLRALDLRV